MRDAIRYRVGHVGCVPEGPVGYALNVRRRGTDFDVSVFREHRTREELNSLLHCGHVIPASRGWTRAYVETHCPGWTWNELVKMFVAAGIFVNRGGAPPKCDDRVVVFHFSSAEEFYVEWVNGVEPEDVA